MKKLLILLASALLVCLVAGCNSAPQDSSAPQGGPDTSAPEPAASAGSPANNVQSKTGQTKVVDAIKDMPVYDSTSGMKVASRGDRMYFAYDNGGDESGVYQLVLSDGTAEMLARGTCSYLCLDENMLYTALQDGRSQLQYVDLDTNETGLAAGASGDIVDIAWCAGETVKGFDDEDIQQEWLVYLDNGDLIVVEPIGPYLDYLWEKAKRAAEDRNATSESAVNVEFTELHTGGGAIDQDDDKYTRYGIGGVMTPFEKDGLPEHTIDHVVAGDTNLFMVYYDEDNGGTRLGAFGGPDTRYRASLDEEIAKIDEQTPAAVGDTVYFLMSDGGSDELVYWNSEGGIQQTGVVGDFEKRLVAYGDYVFYSKQAEPEGSSNSFIRPFCYNTKTGEEFAFDRDWYEDKDLILIDVAGGYMYLEESSGDESYFDSIADPNGSVAVEAAIAGGAPTQELAQKEEEERRAAEEEARNEPYGPGTSTLYLSAPSNHSACYRLVRRDGSTEFMVLLGPGEESTQTFPCGRYILKIAEGDEWISDEEAFGPNANYDTTDLFNFEPGGAYEIGSGARGDFSGDSQGGFVG